MSIICDHHENFAKILQKFFLTLTLLGATNFIYEATIGAPRYHYLQIYSPSLVIYNLNVACRRSRPM